MPYSKTMQEIQTILVERYDQAIDIDGLVGPATEGAILAVLMANAPINEDAAPAADGAVRYPVREDVPHISQGDSSISGIWLGHGTNADTCRKSGCLSCALWIVLTAQDACKVDCAQFIHNNVDDGCYNETSIINQAKVCERYGFVYQRDITDYAAKNYLKDGIPVILQIRKPHTHFLVGLGYDMMKGYAYHDPGTREGNFYDDARWLPESDVTRYDVAIPDASKKAGA